MLPNSHKIGIKGIILKCHCGEKEINDGREKAYVLWAKTSSSAGLKTPGS